MHCNIDARGKAVRLIVGAFVESIGFLLGIFWFLGMLPDWAGLAGLAAILGGAFMIFEGAAGWCVLRAMGFRTPL